MRRLTINLNGGYDVLISRGILADCGFEIRKVCCGTKALIVCGDNVNALYANTVRDSLISSGFEVRTFAYGSGERFKNTETFLKLLDFMSEFYMCRTDCVIALGGGVTGDIAGFAASCYMRGIDFIQIPTTLLSMVDSSVGGKTAVNLSRGKNLVGSFYQPKLVLIDPNALSTLPREILIDGYAEIAKCAVLCKPHLFSIPDESIEKIIYESLDAKRIYIENDERDRGKRAFLNLGHTIAHAIEKQSDFSISHGKAVAIGLAAVTHYDSTVCGYLYAHGLPTELPYEVEELCKLMISDKKRFGNDFTLVLFKALGDCTLTQVNENELQSALFGEVK